MPQIEKPRITVTAVEVSDEYCRDVMVTCVEGGSNYWASFTGSWSGQGRHRG